MSGNSYKEPVGQPEETEVEVEAAAPKAKGGNRLSRTFFSIMDGSFLKRENAAGQISFLLFLFLIATVYIGNGYYAEKTLRESNQLNNDIKSMQSEYINAQSKLAEKTRQSMIAKQAGAIGLREAIVPPAKLVLNKTSK